MPPHTRLRRSRTFVEKHAATHPTSVEVQYLNPFRSWPGPLHSTNVRPLPRSCGWRRAFLQRWDFSEVVCVAQMIHWDISQLFEICQNLKKNTPSETDWGVFMTIKFLFEIPTPKPPSISPLSLPCSIKSPHNYPQVVYRI